MKHRLLFFLASCAVAFCIGFPLQILGVTRELTISGSPLVFYERASSTTISITCPVVLNSTETIEYVSVRIISDHEAGEWVTVNAIPELANFTLTWSGSDLTIRPNSPIIGIHGGTIEKVLNNLLYIWPNNATVHNPNRKIEINIVESGRAFNHPDGTLHFYSFITTGQSWMSARSDAPNQLYYGKKGYLATMTTAGEDEFAHGQAPGQAGWVGGSDSAVEGTWRWVTGPEGARYGTDGGVGLRYWQGTGGGSKVTADGIDYKRWNTGEPNNSGGEDYMQELSDGSWNDLNGTQSLGYFIEWGGMGEPGNTLEIRILPSNAFKSAAGF